MYSTPFDALFRNWLAFERSLVRRRATDRSIGNMAMVSPVKPNALMTSRPLNSGAAVSGAGGWTLDWAMPLARGAIKTRIAGRTCVYRCLRMSTGVGVPPHGEQ